MQFSAQEEYGLRCLLQVARNENQSPLQITQIAAKEGLSIEYTAKLMRCLRRGALVNSTRGKDGGYRLARDPQKINILDVIAILGGPMFSLEFCSAHSGKMNDCTHFADCSMRALWQQVESAVSGVLKNISLADMARSERPMRAWLKGKKLGQSGVNKIEATLKNAQKTKQTKSSIRFVDHARTRRKKALNVL